MIIIMKATATTTDITDLKDRLESRGLRAVVMQGQEKTAVGVIGETRLHLPADQILALPSVESIRRVSDPCKLANRLFHPEDTIVKAGSAKVGGGHFAMIAGPCSIESEEQIVGIAKAESRWRHNAPRRRLQAAYVALRFPGAQKRRA